MQGVALPGGGGGIRTPGSHKATSGFQDRLLKPLGHPSLPVSIRGGPHTINAAGRRELRATGALFAEFFYFYDLERYGKRAGVEQDGQHAGVIG